MPRLYFPSAGPYHHYIRFLDIANIMRLTPSFVALSMHITCITLCQPIHNEDNFPVLSKRSGGVGDKILKVRMIKVLCCHFHSHGSRKKTSEVLSDAYSVGMFPTLLRKKTSGVRISRQPILREDNCQAFRSVLARLSGTRPCV
jgi:hypothetical protein